MLSTQASFVICNQFWMKGDRRVVRRGSLKYVGLKSKILFCLFQGRTEGFSSSWRCLRSEWGRGRRALRRSALVLFLKGMVRLWRCLILLLSIRFSPLVSLVFGLLLNSIALSCFLYFMQILRGVICLFIKQTFGIEGKFFNVGSCIFCYARRSYPGLSS